jgi:four helix bundle protein
LNIAEESLSETKYLVTVSRDLRYITTEIAAKSPSEATEVLKMLSALRKKVEEGAQLTI